MEQRRPPSASRQDDEADDDHHRDCDARHHQAKHSGQETESVAAVDRSVVIRQDEVPEPEDECAREPDLEGAGDVRGARSEQHEQRRRRGGDPRSHARSEHHDQEERGRGQMRHHREQLIREVGV